MQKVLTEEETRGKLIRRVLISKKEEKFGETCDDNLDRDDSRENQKIGGSRGEDKNFNKRSVIGRVQDNICRKC